MIFTNYKKQHNKQLL